MSENTYRELGMELLPRRMKRDALGTKGRVIQEFGSPTLPKESGELFCVVKYP